MKLRLTILFVVLVLVASAQRPNFSVQQPVFKKDSFFITKYGAKPDGVTLNTQSIQQAIDACNKGGGGIVVVPEGMWLTGPLVLKSNVNLHLKRNALLQFTADKNQYALVAGNWEGLSQMRAQSPLSADNATNIAITGFGIVDGNGDAWRAMKRDKVTETQWKRLVSSGGVLSEDKKTWYPSESSKYGSTLKNPGEIKPDKTKEFYASIKDFCVPTCLFLRRVKKFCSKGSPFKILLPGVCIR